MCDTMSGLDCYFHMNVVDGEVEAWGEVTSLKQSTGSSENRCLPFHLIVLLS